MIVKMASGASAEEINAVEEELHALGYHTGEMIGEEIAIIGVYGDVSALPQCEIQGMKGVDTLIPISRPYKRAAQKGNLHRIVQICNVAVGGSELAVIAGPCSVESEKQIIESARMIKNAGADILRGGVVKYRSSPYSGWEGIGAGSKASLKSGLELIVRAGKLFELPTVVEVLDSADVPFYEDAGVDCLQIGEPNSKNQALLDRLRETPLPVIHKRGNSLDIEAYLLWVERILVAGKENVILCERGIVGPNKYTRNTLDIGAVAAFHYQLSCLPVAVDASHGVGIRDLVIPITLAGVMAGARAVLVEAHPNPFVARSDGHQSLFPEQLTKLVAACRKVWHLRQEIEPLYLPSVCLEEIYKTRVPNDHDRFFNHIS